MEGGKSNKRQAGEAVARADGQSSAKRQNVTMGLDTLDCPICSQPLRPPIFQCPKGNFICSLCCQKLPEREHSASRRCYGVERIINNTFVPCKHGCWTKITYYEKEHEKQCVQGPCACPVSGCGFAAKTRALLNHLTTLHKFPAQRIRYFVPFELRVQPGSHVLCGAYRRLFLLNVASLPSLGHSVSIVCAQPSVPSGTIGCSVGFSCFKGHYQVSSLDIGRSTLSDRTQSFCVVPKVSGGQTDVVLRMTISLMYEHDDEKIVEDDDEDNSYNEEEEEEEEEEKDMTTKWKMAVTKLGVKEEDHHDNNVEEYEFDSEEEKDEDIAMIYWTRWGVTIRNEKEDNKVDHLDVHNVN